MLSLTPGQRTRRQAVGVLAGAAVAPDPSTLLQTARSASISVVVRSPETGESMKKHARRKTDPAADLPDVAPISLVLIDDNRLLREGLASLIHTQPGFKVLAASADVDEALAKVRESQPDVVLLDFGLVDHDSLGLTRKVRQEVPAARVIIMGLLPAQEEVATYVRAGASGFIMKDASFEDFFKTIRAVADGAEVLPPALTNSLFTQIVRNVAATDKSKVIDAVKMTAREQQVVALLGEGLSNKEIATRLHIAVHTVKSHVHNVLEKLALHSRLEVVAFTHTGRRSKLADS
jgi:DNA-binding NarL/FixJ family response regulator